jgi:hypothetical protein
MKKINYYYNKTINIVSYSSYEYLDKVLALNNSIKKYKNVKLYLLALDMKIYNFIQKENKEITCYYPKIAKTNFNKNFAQNVSIGRLKFAEYLLTKKKLPNLHLVDSDIYFFSDPSNLKKIVKNYDMAFCYHDANKNNCNTDNKYGIFNAGYLYFKNSPNTKKILKRYISLCKKKVDYSVTENNVKNIFADQTYLEFLTEEFKNILKVKDKSINRGPWNIERYKIKVTNGELFLDNKKLIFYHFSGLKKIFNNLYSLGLRMYVNNKTEIQKKIYIKYIKELKEINMKYKIKKINIKKLHIKGNKINSLLNIIIKKDFLFHFK